ncbi:MAG: ComF family protein [Ruminococcaceae bacterium]|nr:ComF family protein [Oscillospiraceae bacterium]
MGFLQKIINLLIPSNCLLCKNATDGSQLCDECSGKFIRETFLVCPECSKPASKCTCRADFTSHTKTEIAGKRFIALTFYKSKKTWSEERITEGMILSLKDRGAFADYFATILAREIKSLFEREGVDLAEWIITYPPRSVEKYAEKGFDQSEEIARKIAKKLGIKFSPTFNRTNHGNVQKSLSAAERFSNAETSLVPIRERIRKGGKYIVFDDIITTGATIETMAKHLYFLGAEAVFPVSIARTFHSSDKKRNY